MVRVSLEEGAFQVVLVSVIGRENNLQDRQGDGIDRSKGYFGGDYGTVIYQSKKKRMGTEEKKKEIECRITFFLLL